MNDVKQSQLQSKENFSRRKQYLPKEIIESLSAYHAMVEKGISQRQAANEMSIPRSTLQSWLNEDRQTNLPKEVVAFCSTPVGYAFISQLVFSVEFTFLERSSSSIRDMQLFLELSQLSEILASSYGSVHKLSTDVQDAIVDFETAQRSHLAQGMKQKKITVCEDETFHPEICLVGMEPLSGFILAEQYAEKRDADSWTKVMKEVTRDLNVEIIQSVSDGAAGLKKHVEKGLSAHHSPDLFHVQQDITKAMSRPLSAKIKSANAAYEEAQVKWPATGKRVAAAESKLKRCKLHKKIARQARRRISDVYHPFNLDNGKPQDAECVNRHMGRQFDRLEKVIDEAKLNNKHAERLAKARKVMTAMLATLTFFWCMVQAELDAQNLPVALEKLFKHAIMPSLYLELVANKSKSRKRKKGLLKLSNRLRRRYLSSSVWLALSEDEQATVLKTATSCVNYFQRSSSCVEGRNSHLSLYHNSYHKLSDRKLRVKTTIHNYFNRDRRSPTPAEKFFGQKPKDLFEWIVARVNLPKKPKPRAKIVTVKPGELSRVAA